MTNNWPTGEDAIKKHNERVRQAMLDDGYTNDEIDKLLKEMDENPDPGLIELLEALKKINST